MPIPLRDDVPGRVAPIAVIAIIVLNVAVFAYEIALAFSDGGGTGASVDFVDSWGLVPRELLRALEDPGAMGSSVWLTPLTSMFLHGGIVHLAGNLLYLWIFGKSMEDLLGHGRFLVFYLACGLFAAAVHVASAPTSYAATIGASGAVAGVLGGYWVSYPGGRVRLLWLRLRVPALLLLALWVALQVAAGLESRPGDGGGVAWWAHVGGFAAGVALARAMWVRRPTRSRRRI